MATSPKFCKTRTILGGGPDFGSLVAAESQTDEDCASKDGIGVIRSAGSGIIETLFAKECRKAKTPTFTKYLA
jgi:hypothetical protein